MKVLYILIVCLFSSCIYTHTKKVVIIEYPQTVSILTDNPAVYIDELDEKLDENSGIILYDNLIWTFNDSGGKEEIYGIKKSGKIKHEIQLESANNHDWEDIAQDDKHIYIGDFGNNNGSRDNLVIYKFSKKKITNSDEIEKKADKIKFKYANQDDYSFRSTHEFDCEAMFVVDNQIVIFSKDRKNNVSKAYVLPKEEGDYTISPKAEWNVNGLITGADISTDNQYFALIGYKDFQPFIWLFKYDAESIFSKRAVKISMPDIYGAQTEGICFLSSDSLLISCEKTSSFKQQIFALDISDFIKKLE